LQRCGFSGPTLIDHDDVVIAVDARERAGETRIEIDRALPRAARQQEQRRRCAATVQRRDHRELELDLRTLRFGAIFRHLQGSATRGVRGEFQRMLEPAVVQRQRAARLSLGAAAKASAQNACCDHDRQLQDSHTPLRLQRDSVAIRYASRALS